jgi:hypothetical protein
VRHLGVLLDEAGSGALLLETFVNLVNLKWRVSYITGRSREGIGEGGWGLV